MSTRKKDPTQLSSVPLKSKKFLAYLIADLGWKFLMAYVIMEYENKIEHYAFMVLVTMIVTSGFIQIGYILGQAALDKYTHVAVSALDKDNDNPPPSPSPKKSEPDANSTDPDEFM